ncbi:hypothetical protein ACG74X_03090 [Marivita sp. S0852]|uniref:hypothetical protein n=1 Tax=Marivita sp. S0852 TaxID=3373893 RepID=UPI003981DD3D
MAHYATRKQIGDQLDFIITIWRENMKAALDGMSDPDIDSDTFLKKASLLSTGKDAVTSFCPASSPGKLIAEVSSNAKFAPPVFIMSQAAAGFDKAYDAYIASHQSMLDAKYKTIKDDLFNAIDDASMVFKSTTYGQNIIDTVFGKFSKLPFEKPADLDVFIRLFVSENRFIETDKNELSKRVDKGYGQLCRTIMALYLGSRRGPGQNQLVFDTGKTQMTRHGSPFVTKTVTSKALQDKVIAEAWKYRADHVDRFWFDKKPDVTVFRRVHSKPSRLDVTYVGPGFPLQDAMKSATASFTKKTGREPSYDPAVATSLGLLN